MRGSQGDKLTLLSLRARSGYLLALALVVALSAGAALERWILRAAIPPNAVEDFRLMAEAWETIDRFYVDRVAVRHAAMTKAAMPHLRASGGRVVSV